MRTRFGLVVLAPCVCAVLLLCAYFYRLSLEKDRPAPPSSPIVAKAPLSVDAESLQIGTVWAYTKIDWQLSIANKSKDDIHIGKFFTSCSCLAITPEAITVPSGQSRTIRIEIDATPKMQNSQQAEYEDFGVSLQPLVELDGRWKGIDEWRLQGKIRRLLNPSAATIVWDKQSELAGPLAQRTVSLASTALVNSIEVKNAPKTMKIRVDKTGKTAFAIAVEPQPGMSAGKYNYEIDFAARLADGKEIPAAKLSLICDICRDLAASPSSIHFGVCKIGDDRNETVVLHSLTAKKFKLVDVKAEGDGLSSSRNEAFPAAIEVHQKAMHLGDRAGRLLVTLENSEKVRSELVLPVRYHGTSLGIE